MQPTPSCRQRNTRQERRGESGQALVEFAMIAPILFMVLIGIFKCAIAFNHYIILTDAVRAGARQLAVSRGVPNACSNAMSRVKSAASDLDSTQITNLQANVDGASSNCGNLESGNEQGTDAKVTASYPCDLVILGIDFAPSCKLTSTMTERIE
jgi:Flp pilus assembly protein TadG